MSTKITYNNTEIANFDSGAKVLKCNGKTMASDVIVESEGGGSNNSRLWKMNETLNITDNKTFDVYVICGYYYGVDSFVNALLNNDENYFKYSLSLQIIPSFNISLVTINYNDDIIYRNNFPDEGNRLWLFYELPTGELLTWLQANGTPIQ